MSNDDRMPEFIIAPDVEIEFTATVPTQFLNEVVSILALATEQITALVGPFEFDIDIRHPRVPKGYPKFAENSMSDVQHCPACGAIPEMEFCEYYTEGQDESYFLVGCPKAHNNFTISIDHKPLRAGSGDTIQEAYADWLYIVGVYIRHKEEERIRRNQDPRIEVQRKIDATQLIIDNFKNELAELNRKLGPVSEDSND